MYVTGLKTGPRINWQMLFKVAKCKVIHFGNRNAEADYSMEGSNLEAITEERDLGIYDSQFLKG